jgi:hypothetical protein
MTVLCPTVCCLGCKTKCNCRTLQDYVARIMAMDEPCACTQALTCEAHDYPVTMWQAVDKEIVHD